jgi:hypothetical protein
MHPALVVFVLVAGAAESESADRVSTDISARVADDLARVAISVKSTYTPGDDQKSVTIVLGADRYQEAPKAMRPSEERELFRGRSDFGGFENVRIRIQGTVCDRPIAEHVEDGGAALSCPFEMKKGVPISIAVDAELVVPDRYGELSRHAHEVTLAGSWYPFVARIGRPPPHGPHAIALDVPAEYGAVIAGRYFPPRGIQEGPRRRIEAGRKDATSIPVVIVPPSAGTWAIDGGRAIYVAMDGWTVHDPNLRHEKDEQIIEALADGLRFWEEQGLARPSKNAPLLVVETPMRHVLAAATDGMVLVSDRAFRMFPLARLYRFHRFPFLREVYLELLLDRFREKPRAHVMADAVAADLVDRYVKDRYERRENAFDVLDWFSFIPSVDALLYAPDLPFEGAYFRRTKEDDPLRPNLVDYPSTLPRGKIVYEKLLDRIGAERTERVVRRMLDGASLEGAIASELGDDTKAFLATWLRSYPKVQYRLGRWSSEPSNSCPGRPCFLAKVEIVREGERVKEPIEVLLRDDDGHERTVWSEATADAIRTVTATLSAPLDFVEIDPHERIYETPTDDVPSPRFDNRSRPAWKFLLNNWNIALAATAGTIDTALDVGLLRVYDVHWAYAIRATYDPAAISLQGRASYGFGPRVTPADLMHRVGLIVSGEYLRPSFGGTTESALAVSSAIYYLFDTRQTLWAPEGGQGVRATLQYNHTFGQLNELETDGTTRALSQDSASFTLRAFQAWRLGAAHTLALRGTAGSYLFGEPRAQLLYALGGRANVRGYNIDAKLGKVLGIASAEWIHTLIPELDTNAFYISWVSGLDGTLYADAAVLADDWGSLKSTPRSADVGYGLRIFIDYFGVRPGIMAVDVAFPLYDLKGNPGLGPPAVYIDFTQSF